MHSQQDPVAESSSRLSLLIWALVLSLAIGALLVAIGYAFLLPSPTGDTFMTLAGGRDVAQGKLAQPDEWSFFSEGRVWINQSWGTGLLFYSLWQQFGPVALVCYKAAVVVLIAAFVLLAARRFEVDYIVATLVAAFVLVAAASFINIRANSLGLTNLALMLWMLFASQVRPRRVWWVVLLLAVWAHLHGSFIFGICVLGLWKVVQLGMESWESGGTISWKRLWHLPAATVVAIVLAAVTSPFGFRNLTQPFTLLGWFASEPWPLENAEMIPLLQDYSFIETFPGLPWYLFALGSLAAPLVLRLLGPRGELAPILSLPGGLRTKWVFSFLLAAVTIAMALKARRFVPISLISCAPLLAFELRQVWSHRRYGWRVALLIVTVAGCAWLWQTISTASAASNPLAGTPVAIQRKVWTTAALAVALLPTVWAWLISWKTKRSQQQAPPQSQQPANLFRKLSLVPGAIMACTMLIAATTQLRGQLPVDQSGHPLYPTDDLFGRLVMLAIFPEETAEFFTDNELRGNVLTDWEWEGYFYWHYPQIRVSIGGRSRQVYSAAQVRRAQQAYRARDPSVYRQLNIDLILTHDGRGDANRLFSEPNTPWRIIYYDGQAVVAALKNDPEGKNLIRQSKAGLLTYPSPKAEAFTKAAQHLALCSDSSTNETLDAVANAARVFPTQRLYQLFVFQQKIARVSNEDIVRFFESELLRLEDSDADARLKFEMLRSRNYMAQTLANFNTRRQPPDQAKAYYWKKYAEQCAAAAIAMVTDGEVAEIEAIPSRMIELAPIP